MKKSLKCPSRVNFASEAKLSSNQKAAQMFGVGPRVPLDDGFVDKCPDWLFSVVGVMTAVFSGG